ncbi:hypothetical protein A3D05_01295 [Candidatus Gottesmanbacteria bacterium RIFCSPHIGHO2_02_FULL_40_24]|uniref:Uncharacterized protein n=1 Tax=Candidatus Gottesmanbacteria bacterium RIFCSPHIGHO2_01_FULL_40_15 TaxID=1798376 RepID=A0A1F5Z1Q2_9BACT|nr:MAG: hypothetical protein A2777_05270 [Candidatus Gottesmanbacteria bacterium RIFCSPHIGHO2_01_FULL_40_15]OGG17111.1 MAG: hypothetical protein A3D05_01295 [Candidatus Gottesmanbacteria bacterium RIFCSPHIGHO2_02_FULL_40_24]OGG23159.1 MAG: hypothetical protein A3E42_03385 [Candidatus Gottesmanbacteria bacterium RIFCSPHIGHO2_12_FULL_40_13]OGG33968.1 MAG: hypothetical protein A3I80_01000 [Candidatus Gottesmanbacteria bacterium RIFCSPLOWO2_02_FULL_40_10]
MKNDLPFAHLGILILLLLIAVNLLIIDLKLFYPGSSVLFSDIKSDSKSNSIEDLIRNSISGVPSDSCPVSCLDLITQTASAAAIGSPDLTSGQTAQSAPIAQTVQPKAKEYFIPLGQGQTSKNSWDDIIATETLIDPASYGTIKEAYFIVSMKNTTENGSAEAQLYNVTDGYPVYGSHIVMNSKEQTLSSSSFALPQQAKLFRVRLKSTLSFPVSLDNARLKIIAY